MSRTPWCVWEVSRALQWPQDPLEGLGRYAARQTRRASRAFSQCPWCWIGKRRLDTALERLKGRVESQVVWHAFQLNPRAPAEGENKLEMYQVRCRRTIGGIAAPLRPCAAASSATATPQSRRPSQAKFGPRAEPILERLRGVFREEGLELKMGGLTGNTFTSHCLMAWAATRGPKAQHALAEEMFRAYFSQEQYIGDAEVLAACAKRAGLEGAEAVLADPGAFAAEVRAELASGPASKYRVTGVPFFVIDGQHQLSGAQPPEAFEEVLEDCLAQRQGSA